jgi:putative transposase
VGKLSNRDIQNIIQQWLQEEPVIQIAKEFQVTRQRVYQLITSFNDHREYPHLKRPGRKPQPIDERTEEFILESYPAHKLGPTHLEKKIEETHGIHIPHNRIYRVLLSHDLIKINMKKRKQRKWVRYERDHSMSMWQGDWKELDIDGSRKGIVAFIDDSSRLITCHGIFDSPTTENTIAVLAQVKEFLDQYDVRHIVARVKYPQTNGKIERFFGEVERMIKRANSVDEIVHWHNVIKPHMSLDYDEPCNVFWYRLPQERILSYAQKWLYV